MGIDGDAAAEVWLWVWWPSRPRATGGLWRGVALRCPSDVVGGGVTRRVVQLQHGRLFVVPPSVVAPVWRGVLCDRTLCPVGFWDVEIGVGRCSHPAGHQPVVTVAAAVWARLFGAVYTSRGVTASVCGDQAPYIVWLKHASRATLDECPHAAVALSNQGACAPRAPARTWCSSRTPHCSIFSIRLR